MDQDTTKALIEAVNTTNKRMDSIESQIKVNREDIKEIKQNVKELKQDLDEMGQDIGHELSEIKSLIQRKEFKKIEWNGSLVALTGSIFTAISVLINQIVFRLFP